MLCIAKDYTIGSRQVCLQKSESGYGPLSIFRCLLVIDVPPQTTFPSKPFLQHFTEKTQIIENS